jgi:hypothetical protein
MTPSEFYEAMRKIYPESGIYDNESSHCEADRLMVSLIQSLGYGEGAFLFAASRPRSL